MLVEVRSLGIKDFSDVLLFGFETFLIFCIIYKFQIINYTVLVLFCLDNVFEQMQPPAR